jgi:hypothetical protein
MMTRDREVSSTLFLSAVVSNLWVGNSISMEDVVEVCGNGAVGWVEVDAPSLTVFCVFVFFGGAGAFFVLVLFEGGSVNRKIELVCDEINRI